MTGADLAGAIEKIAQLTKASIKPEIITSEQEPDDVYFITRPDGTLDKITAGRRWIDDTLHSVGELATYADALKGENSAIFISPAKVVFIYDRLLRQDKATVQLTRSQQFIALEQAAARQPLLSQADLIRLLRVTLRGALPTGSTLLALLRDLKFVKNTDGQSVANHGRESLSRNVLAGITGAGAIPEEVTLAIPVFEGRVKSYSVSCALELFPHEEKTRITPFPGELIVANRDAIEDIRAEITEILGHAIPIYLGETN